MYVCLYVCMFVCLLACLLCLFCIYIYMYVCMYVCLLVSSFNFESRACYVGNPRESFFFEFAKVKFYFAKVARKLDILIIM